MIRLSNKTLVLRFFGEVSRIIQQWMQITRYRWNVMMITNDRRMPSSADRHEKTESTARGEQPVEGNSNRCWSEERMNIYKHQYELAVT